jgi:hypothetical protein
VPAFRAPATLFQEIRVSGSCLRNLGFPFLLPAEHFGNATAGGRRRAAGLPSRRP